MVRIATSLGMCLVPIFWCQATVVLEIGTHFTASSYGFDSPYVPPDSNGAVGPNHFVEFINGRFAVFDKATGGNLQSFTDIQFWTNAGVRFSSGVGFSDPRIIFDRLAQRWFASGIDTATANNRFLLAISTSIDPTQPWQAVAFTPSSGNFADFPTLGLDANGVYLAGDLFDLFGNQLNSSVLVSIPKADLLGSSPSISNRTTFNTLTYSNHGAVFQPAINFEPPSGGANIVAVGNLGIDFVPHSNLFGFKVLNSASARATLSSAQSISVPAYSVPINPTQPDGQDDLDDGDSRFSANVYQVGSIIYGVHAAQISNHTAVVWYKLQATNFALVQRGIISQPPMDFFFPSIAANTNGHVVIGFNGCSTTNFVSCYAVVGETVNGITIFGSKILLKAGTANYHNFAGSGGTTSRWGDYSAMSVDPENPNSFWSIQMYPSGEDVWATYIAELRVTPVELMAKAVGTNILLSWPGNASDFTLQSANFLPASNTWSTVVAARAISNDLVYVLLPRNTNTFFRLIKL